MNESDSKTTTDNAIFNVDDWITNSGEAMSLNIKKQFLEIPDHLYDATQDGTFNICLLNDLDSDLKTLKSLNPDYAAVHVPSRHERVRNILCKFHCDNLSDHEPEVVNGLPELIILAYDLEGDSGEILFGAEGQQEVLNRLRSFKHSRKLAEKDSSVNLLERVVKSDTDLDLAPPSSAGPAIEPSGSNLSFSLCEWLEKISQNIVSKIKSQFLEIPDHLYDATQGKFFDTCLLNDLDSDLETLKSLNPDYAAVHVPDTDERVRNILHALHCEYLSDYEPEVVNGLPELIILAYDLEGDSGEILFGVEGQQEVLNQLRGFKYSKPDKTKRKKIVMVVAVPVVATIAFISFWLMLVS